MSLQQASRNLEEVEKEEMMMLRVILRHWALMVKKTQVRAQNDVYV